MTDVIEAGHAIGATPVVEVVVHEGDIFPVLERNAAFFTERVRS
jgi:hypothetical protein